MVLGRVLHVAQCSRGPDLPLSVLFSVTVVGLRPVCEVNLSHLFILLLLLSISQTPFGPEGQ